MEVEPELVTYSDFLNNTFHAAPAECYVFREKRFFFFFFNHLDTFFLEGFIILSKPRINPLCNLLIWDCHLRVRAPVCMRRHIHTQMDGAPNSLNRESPLMTGREWCASVFGEIKAR